MARAAFLLFLALLTTPLAHADDRTAIFLSGAPAPGIPGAHFSGKLEEYRGPSDGGLFVFAVELADGNGIDFTNSWTLWSGTAIDSLTLLVREGIAPASGLGDFLVVPNTVTVVMNAAGELAVGLLFGQSLTSTPETVILASDGAGGVEVRYRSPVQFIALAGMTSSEIFFRERSSGLTTYSKPG